MTGKTASFLSKAVLNLLIINIIPCFLILVSAAQLAPPTSTLPPFLKTNVPSNECKSFPRRDLEDSTELLELPKTSSPQEGTPKIVYIHWGHSAYLDDMEKIDDTFYTFNSREFHCPNKCLFTYDPSVKTLAHLLVYNVLDFGVDVFQKLSKLEIPIQRPQHQVWALFIDEPPTFNHYLPRLKVFNDRFNWSISYRLDSDVYFPYGQVYRRKIPLDSYQFGNILQQVTKKTRLAAWIVSNCVTQSARGKLVTQLQKLMDIDIYGKCGHYTCPADDLPLPLVPMSCQESIGPMYKFYLAFENSLCVDYVTEKFFQALHSDMVPITYGMADYAKIAPPHSYINILDFTSIEQFADYIHFLDQNPQEYAKYFYWKKKYLIHTIISPLGLCNMCNKLHEQQGKIKILQDFACWWTSIPPAYPPFQSSLYNVSLLELKNYACVNSNFFTSI